MNHNNLKPYWSLGCMALLHFIAMYVLMYAMVDGTTHIYPNHNQLYMALLMTSPMLILEFWLMASMYRNQKLNVSIVGAGIVLLIGSFFFIREQIAIDDKQFLQSMIPHHAGAILMCKKASIKDPEIEELCESIISSQQQEIDWMTIKLETLK